MGDSKGTKKCSAWSCRILEAVLRFTCNFLRFHSDVRSLGCLSSTGPSPGFLHGESRREGQLANIMQKPTINPQHFSNIYGKCLLVESLPKCMCFWSTDNHSFHGALSHHAQGALCTKPGSILQAIQSFSVQCPQLTFSKSLACLGQTHLIDLEAPWPSEASPFTTVLHHYKFSWVIIFWPLTHESLWSMMERNFVTNIRWFIYIVLGVESHDGFLVNLWIFKNVV